jgi:conjugal transfer/entry exclusion protein
MSPPLPQPKRELQIEELKKEITKYEFVVSKGKNLLQKNLQYFQQKNNEFEENKELLSYLDSYETRVGELQTKYNKAFDKFDLQRLHIKKIETSFLKTFKKVYKEIYNDEKCSFGFRMAIKRDIRTKKYFTIEAHIDKE